MRDLVRVLRLKGAVAVVAITTALAGCGGDGRSGAPLSVTEVKRAFAAVGLPLRPNRSVGVAPPANAYPGVERPEAWLTGGPSAAEVKVIVFRHAGYARKVAAQVSPLPAPARQKRVANILITWLGVESPELRAAIQRLR